MSRLHPTLEYFTKDDAKYEVVNHKYLTIAEKVEKKYYTPELLKSFKSAVRERNEYLTEQMLDRSFYYYDSKEYKNRWVRNFEHVHLDIAVVLDTDYMYDESKPVLSFPKGLRIYQREPDGDLLMDTYEFNFKSIDRMPTGDDIKDFTDQLLNGIDELLTEVDKRVYRL